MGSLQLGLYCLLIVILSEYGFRLWRSAVVHFRRGWAWEMSGLRIALWAGIWAYLADFSVVRLSWLGFLLCSVTTEAIVIALRRFVGMTRPLGSVLAHLFPLVAALAFGAGVHSSTGGGLLEFHGWMSTKLLAALAAVTMLLCWGTLFTVSIVAKVGVEPLEQEAGSQTGSSEILGILERLVIFVLVLSDELTAGVLLAVVIVLARILKTRADPGLTEYNLISALSSIGIAVGAGLSIQMLP